VILTSPPRAAGWLRCFWLHGFGASSRKPQTAAAAKITPHRMNVESQP